MLLHSLLQMGKEERFIRKQPRRNKPVRRRFADQALYDSIRRETTKRKLCTLQIPFFGGNREISFQILIRKPCPTGDVEVMDLYSLRPSFIDKIHRSLLIIQGLSGKTKDYMR